MDEPSVLSSSGRSMLRPSSSANTRFCFIYVHGPPRASTIEVWVQFWKNGSVLAGDGHAARSGVSGERGANVLEQ